MTFPILEHDPTPEAFIEPSKVIKPRDMPTHCVPCFFGDVIHKVAAEHSAKVITENRWEDGPHQVYEINYQGQRLAFYHPGIGSALSAGILEEVIAFGGRKFVACGGCGTLEPGLTLGHLVVVASAVRDEGASYHYLPPAREVSANPQAVSALVTTLESQNLRYRLGKTWTTDAPYRETPAKIANRRAEGCLVVEMECAGMLAVAQFRNVPFGQLLYGGDDLSGEVWDNRAWQSRADIRENLFWLSAQACLAL
jgi:uridine phosphorylase